MMILLRDKSQFHKAELSVRQVSLFSSNIRVWVVWSQLGHSVTYI